MVVAERVAEPLESHRQRLGIVSPVAVAVELIRPWPMLAAPPMAATRNAASSVASVSAVMVMEKSVIGARRRVNHQMGEPPAPLWRRGLAEGCVLASSLRPTPATCHLARDDCRIDSPNHPNVITVGVAVREKVRERAIAPRVRGPGTAPGCNPTPPQTQPAA
jgi:hypothetical protein